MNGKKAKAARRAAKRLSEVLKSDERKIYQGMKATLNEPETRKYLYADSP